MNAILDKRICAFIARHHVLSLATVDGVQPWCCSLFYAFDSESLQLIFSSADTTRHIVEATASHMVACSIVVESRVVGRLQGAQITGRLRAADSSERSSQRYLARFPFAALHLEKLWVVEIDTIKYTDNTLGFGKKLYFDAR